MPRDRTAARPGIGARAALLLVLVPIVAALDAGAQPPRADALAAQVEGRWQIAISATDAQRRIDAAIGSATTGMLPIVDRAARSSLLRWNTISPIVGIELADGRVRVRFHDATFDTPADREISMRLPDSDRSEGRVFQGIRDGALVQVFTTEQGRRWNTWTADRSGLVLDVVEHSDRLPSDVRYHLPYRRAP